MSSKSQRLSAAGKPSTAKLAYIPENSKKSKSLGRTLLSKMNIFSDLSSHHTSPISKRPTSQISSTSRRSQDLDSTGAESSRQSRNSSRATSRSSQRSSDVPAPQPLPRKTSLARSSVSESESRNLSSLDSRIGRNMRESKSKSSVVIHTDRHETLPVASQRFKENSTNKQMSVSSNDLRISMQDFINTRNQKIPTISNTESMQNQQSGTPVTGRRQAETHRRPSDPSFSHPNQLPQQTTAPLWTPQVPRRGQNANDRRNEHFSVAAAPTTINMRRERTESWTPSFQRREFNLQPSSEKLNNWRAEPLENKNSWLTKSMQHRSTEDILALNEGRRFKWDDTNNLRARSTWFIDRSTEDLTKLSRNQDGFRKTETNQLTPRNNDGSADLNSLQVFKQPKYKDRHLSERKIRQQHHLQSNEDCNDLVRILSKEFHPSMYANTNPLEVVQHEFNSSTVTSSRFPIKADRIEIKPKFFSINKEQPVKEHIYAEIDEGWSPIHTPVMHRRVTFATTHDPFTESDYSILSKKILPATLWGIVEVKSALREKQDEERRGVARLCYHAVKMAAPDNSLKFLGKVDRNRYGESVYVILENGCFEVRDGEGLIIAKHKSRDISVVTEIEGDSNVFVYIGRCKFGGRIGMVLKFNKFRHISIVIDFFKKG